MRAPLLAALVLCSCGRTGIYDFVSRLDPPVQAMPDAGRIKPDEPCIFTPAPQIGWQIHSGPGVICFGKTFDKNGDTGEYAFVTIPPEADPEWFIVPDPDISFSTQSLLCGGTNGPVCPCRAGGDFTFFQTVLELPVMPKTLSVTIREVDDGARITLFNSKHPEGFTAGFAFFLGQNTTADMAAEAVVGHNRVVLTHVDDCCMDRRLARAFVTLDGANLTACP